MPKSTLFNNPKYYEAIIQLRPFDEGVFNFIKKEIGEPRGKRVFISRIDELKTGIDIYMSSQKFARNLGQKMKRKFRGWKLLITRKMVTADKMESRNLYRATILFRREKNEVSED
jgi:NMD protein affecting ribosome stability and mRNA decay